MSIIKVQGLTKTYGAMTAVDHISFEVERGTMLGFLGINGAGKTTAINMLSTLLKPDGGSARLCGYTVGQNDMEIRRKIGIVYQQNCLDDMLSVRENLLCRGILHGISKKQAVRQLRYLSEILNLDEILKKKYRMLSGGQKRRCEIAAALMHTPQILFLDEPTTGLDPATRRDVWTTIEELRKNEKITVFLTTHYMEEAAGADKIIIMDHGKIVVSGTTFELKEKYAMDKLRLYFSDSKFEAIRPFLDFGLPVKRLEHKGVEILLKSTMDAIPVLQALKGKMDVINGKSEINRKNEINGMYQMNGIDGIEVILGNMDDVFLNAVGYELED